jgi:hypothetical protein
MLEREKRLYLVEDATWGLGLEPREALLAAWEGRGVRLVSTARVTAEYPPRLDAR